MGTPGDSAGDSGGQSADRKKWFGGFSEFNRHPAVLVIFGFILTGIVGRYLANIQDEKQHHREVVAASIDQLRTSMDDLSVSFTRLRTSTLLLIQLRESGARGPAVATAQSGFDAVYEEWMERSAVDIPNIIQRYPQKRGETDIQKIVHSLNIGVASMDLCVTYGWLRPLSPPYSDKKYDLVCGSSTNSQNKPLTAFEQLLASIDCMREFYTLRPGPNDNFDDPENRDWSQTSRLQNSEHVCKSTLTPPSLETRKNNELHR